MLDLNARIHLDENMLTRAFARGVEKKLDGTRVDVPDRSCKGDGVSEHRLTNALVKIGGWRNFDDFLMTTLD